MINAMPANEPTITSTMARELHALDGSLLVKVLEGEGCVSGGKVEEGFESSGAERDSAGPEFTGSMVGVAGWGRGGND